MNVMEKVFVFLITESGFEYAVLKDLKDIPEVRETFMLFGIYDILVQLEGKLLADMKKVINEIKQLEKVRSAMTMITYSNPYSPISNDSN